MPSLDEHMDDLRPENPHPNLRLNVEELGSRLCGAVRRRAWLDAYLYAAGLSQIVEDHAHRDTLYLGAVGDELVSKSGRVGALAGRAAISAASLTLGVRSRSRSSRELATFRGELETVVLALAAAASADSGVDDAEAERIASAAEQVGAGVAALPASLRVTTVRPPGCFHAFDLEVADVRSLTAELVHTRPERSRPLIVAGVRSSGSYLAPLCVALLRSEGYADVQLLTLRPEHQLERAERRLVRRLSRRRGLVVVVDDPPGSGRSVASAAGQIARCGLPRTSIVLMLPLFGGRDQLPQTLRGHASFLLPSDEWAINAKLAPAAVRDALERLAPPGVRVTAVEPAPLADRPWRRSHERRLFRVTLAEEERTRTVSLLAEGVGIGYFGEHALTIARSLHEHVPEVFGLAGGCLFRTWLPDEARSCPVGSDPSDGLVEAVAHYVAERRRRLPMDRDRAADLFGEAPAWEVVSRILSRAFGRGALPSRPLLVDALTRRLLEVRHASIVDGSTALSNWFDGTQPGSYLKVDFATRSFWNLGLTCYDASFDVAGAAVSAPSDATAAALRSRYSGLTGESIDDERWFLYELAQLWGLSRTREHDGVALRRDFARALQRYLARVFLADVTRSPDGPLCAIDLDGVLDTETLGFPGTTASGAMALRTLLAHGYRPVPVSGRAVDEVADRCRSYGLAGGVAEYGSAVYVTASARTQVLLSDADRSLLERIRTFLAAEEHVSLDNSYRRSVRAFVVDRSGRRTALDRETVAAACAVAGDSGAVRAIEGEAQTDFVVASIDKGRGVRALASLLDTSVAPGEPVLAFAIGDTAADVPMFREARLAFAPANAEPGARGPGVQVLSAPYQAGLSVAVGRLVGHAPGGCPVCRAPELTPGAALLVGLLSVREGGRLELARRFLRLRRRLRTGR
jgi:hypothetical protein